MMEHSVPSHRSNRESHLMLVLWSLCGKLDLWRYSQNELAPYLIRAGGPDCLTELRTH
jgi:hypothetical protein